MRLIDEQYTAHPFYGSRRMSEWLIERGEEVNRKRVQRLMRVMGLEAIYPKPRLSAAGPGASDLPVPAAGREDRAAGSGLEHRHHLRADGRRVHVPGGGDRLVQPIRDRLAAVEHARRVVLPGDAGGGLEAGKPEVFNTDQGVQFTAEAFAGCLERAGVAVSMDGGGVPGQRVRGAAVEEREIRGYLHEATRRCRSCTGGWAGTSASTTRSVFISRWTTGPRRRSMGRGDPGGGRRGEGEAFFFAPPSLSPGEGRAVRKRMPRSRGDGQRRGRAEFSRTVAKEGTFLV